MDGAAGAASFFGQAAALGGLRYARAGLGLVDTREALIDPVDELRRTSLDPYASYRSAYRQRRQADIENRLGPAVTSDAAGGDRRSQDRTSRPAPDRLVRHLEAGLRRQVLGIPAPRRQATHDDRRAG